MNRWLALAIEPEAVPPPQKGQEPANRVEGEINSRTERARTTPAENCNNLQKACLPDATGLSAGSRNLLLDTNSANETSIKHGSDGFLQVLTHTADETDEKEIPETSKKIDGSPQSKVAGDAKKTWTGRIVSLAEWREMSNWERHGSTGKMYCGVCREWLVDCNHIKAAKELER